MTPTTVRHVEPQDDLRLDYAQQGPSDSTWLLLHGIAESWRGFERLMRALTACVCVSAPTQIRIFPGAGPTPFLQRT